MELQNFQKREHGSYCIRCADCRNRSTQRSREVTMGVVERQDAILLHLEVSRYVSIHLCERGFMLLGEGGVEGCIGINQATTDFSDLLPKNGHQSREPDVLLA
jgi:hypothetical protein